MTLLDILFRLHNVIVPVLIDIPERCIKSNSVFVGSLFKLHSVLVHKLLYIIHAFDKNLYFVAHFFKLYSCSVTVHILGDNIWLDCSLGRASANKPIMLVDLLCSTSNINAQFDLLQSDYFIRLMLFFQTM